MVRQKYATKKKRKMEFKWRMGLGERDQTLRAPGGVFKNMFACISEGKAA